MPDLVENVCYRWASNTDLSLLKVHGGLNAATELCIYWPLDRKVVLKCRKPYVFTARTSIFFLMLVILIPSITSMGDKCLESRIAMISLMSRQFTFQTKWVKEQRRDQLFAELIMSSLKAYQTRKVVVLSSGFLRLQQIQVQLKCSKPPSLGMGYGSWRSGSLKIKGVSYCFPNCSGGRKPFAACSVQPWDWWEARRSLVNKQEALELCKWRNSAYKAEFYTELVICHLTQVWETWTATPRKIHKYCFSLYGFWGCFLF